MKTKTFLLLCLLSGIGLTSLTAQNGKNGTGAVTYDEIWDAYAQPVYCNGAQVDLLTGTVSIHSVAIFKDNVLITINQHLYGEVISSVTDEKFKVNEIDKSDMVTMQDPFHCNFIGNKGSHYIGFFTWDLNTELDWHNYVFIRGVCPGNDK
jgi:hypothetical protein